MKKWHKLDMFHPFDPVVYPIPMFRHADLRHQESQTKFAGIRPGFPHKFDHFYAGLTKEPLIQWKDKEKLR